MNLLKKISLFKKVYSKVYDSGRIHQLFSNRLVFFTGLQLLLQPKTKKSLEILQVSIDQKIMRKLRKKYKADIEYFKNNIDSFKQEEFRPSDDKSIWVLWYQGIESAPFLVKQCLESLKRNLPKDRQLVTLDKMTLNDYINLPSFIMEKYKAGKISHAHFSDIVRIELLSKYGGTWIDATVFMSSPVIHDYFFDSDLFLFQELRPNTFGHSRRVSSWFITAKKNNEIVLLTRYLMRKYWEENNSLIEYFLLHSLFELAIEAYPKIWETVIPFSNSHPHVLQFKLFHPFNDYHWQEIRKLVEIHKLTYKYEEKNYNGTYLNEVVLK
ncbi:capsular polysaccharide synthesis protein [Streptococcus ruminantium]|uniref:capsular polysaccharide synthesis protein n=1 Tax=Streptococcus ruminantium TaxID=1917441 RepID=UPI0012DFBB96|nr:capsular polysaccharide synthesis protein [Streptococcus ruminantium]